MNFYLLLRCSFQRKLFYKSNRKLFSCICIAWYKHSRDWENSRQLCKPETKSRVCITVWNPPNPSRVYMRLCKHGKRFLLLNWWVIFHVSKIRVLSNQMNTLRSYQSRNHENHNSINIIIEVKFLWLNAWYFARKKRRSSARGGMTIAINYRNKADKQVTLPIRTSLNYKCKGGI